MALAVLIPPPDIGFDRLLERSIESDRTSLSLPMGRLPSSLPLCAVVCDGQQVRAVIVLRPGKRSDSFSRVHQISAIRVLEKPVSIRSVVEACAPGLSRHIVDQFSQTRELSSAVEKAFFKFISKKHPKSHAVISEMAQRAIEESQGMKGMSREDRVERDAMLLAGEIFGGRSARNYIADSMPLSSSGAVPVSLRSEVGINLSERDAIDHDAMAILPEAIRKRLGAMVTLRDDHGTLTAFVTDRRKVESSHGVDLIYHIPYQERFILIQYKLMKDWAGASPVYRPDGDPNFSKQMQVMQKLRASWGTRFSSAGEYRLCSDPFFFKFVNPAATFCSSDALLAGMYIARRHVLLTLKDNVSKGPRGGRVIGWEFHDRHLSNSEFVRLFRKGWTGTHGIATVKVREVLKACFGQSVLIYAHQATNIGSGYSYRRDHWGRFTEVDDPFGLED